MRYWKKAILDCKASSLTVREFCQDNGLNVHAYYYWQRQIRKEMLDEQARDAALPENMAQPMEQETPAPPKRASNTPDIVPLSAALNILDTESVGLPAANPLVTIRYAGIAIDVRAGTTPELIHLVMSAIREEASSC